MDHIHVKSADHIDLHTDVESQTVLHYCSEASLLDSDVICCSATGWY